MEPIARHFTTAIDPLRGGMFAVPTDFPWHPGDAVWAMTRDLVPVTGTVVAVDGEFVSIAVSGGLPCLVPAACVLPLRLPSGTRIRRILGDREVAYHTCRTDAMRGKIYVWDPSAGDTNVDVLKWPYRCPSCGTWGGDGACLCSGRGGVAVPAAPMSSTVPEHLRRWPSSDMAARDVRGGAVSTRVTICPQCDEGVLVVSEVAAGRSVHVGPCCPRRACGHKSEKAFTWRDDRTGVWRTGCGDCAATAAPEDDL